MPGPALEPSRPRRPSVVWPAFLFLVTLLTTLWAGFIFQYEYVSGFSDLWGSPIRILLVRPLALLQGLPYCLTVLLILLSHEMGHYLACRYYQIQATLPYVIPAPPLLNPFGTFGAVIKIQSPFRNRAQLFDVGIAGPLAGFAVMVPAVWIGYTHARAIELDSSTELILQFGEPLLFVLCRNLLDINQPSELLMLHPVGMAAWLGALATSLNLLPIGQLDGGHIVYALFGPRWHKIITVAGFAGLIIMGLLFWPGYLLFAVILIFLGVRHPRPYVEFTRPGQGRLLLALVALVVFVLTFMPTPVEILYQWGKL